MKNRVIQLTPSITAGDAVSNDILAMQEVLTELGFDNQIYAINIGEKVRNRAKSFSSYKPRRTDVLLYHMSIGSDMSRFVLEAEAHLKLMVYHNITPPDFFEGFPAIQTGCRAGREEVRRLASCIDFAFADSDYNREELDALGYRRTRTLPIIIDKREYLDMKPSEAVLKTYRGDGFVNILFVGRFAPNKRQEDIIKSFHLYNRYINPKSRLFLIGSSNGTEHYFYSLKNCIKALGVQNVIFPGHVSFSDIVAYYRLADVFLCMSEHEGFCVPLLEAMVFDVPIVAYASSAVPGTLGGSGVLMPRKDYPLIAELLGELAANQVLRDAVIAGQQRRLADFDSAAVRADFGAAIRPLLTE